MLSNSTSNNIGPIIGTHGARTATCHGSTARGNDKLSYLIVVKLAVLSALTSAFSMLMLSIAQAPLKRSLKIGAVGGKAPRLLKQQAVPGLEPKTTTMERDRAQFM